MFILIVALAIFATCFDLASFVLGVRRLRGDGPSGFPLVGLIVFSGAMVIGRLSGLVEVATFWQLMKVYALFHFLLNFGLLLLIDRVLRVFGR